MDSSNIDRDGESVQTPKNHFRALWEGGFRRLVPIVPPDAELSPHSHMAKKPQCRGKAVGELGPYGWKGFDWHRHETTEPDLDRWAPMGAGVGVRMGEGLVAIDIDSLVKELSLTAMEAAFEILGEAPLRIGRAPKLLMLYRCTGDVPYERVEFSGLDGKTERVEALGAGQQAVFAGIHSSTGKPYMWPNGLPVRDELTVVTPEQVRAYFDRLLEIMPDAHRPAAPNSQDRSQVDQRALEGPIEAVRAAVDAIPNDRSDRAWFLRMGYAIKAAVAYDPEEAFDIFWSWCLRWTVRDKDYNDAWAFWRSLRPPFALGAPYLYGEAAKHTGENMAPPEQFFEPIEGDDPPPSPGEGANTVWDGEPVDIFGDDDPAELSAPPAECLPSVIEGFVRTEAARKGVSEAFAAATAVTAIGGAIGSTLALQPKRHDTGWVVYAALPAVLVARPGRKKSPLIAAALRPLRDLDREHGARWQREHAAWEAVNRPTRGRGGTPPKTPEPALRQHLVDDATLEKQVRIHASNPRGVLRAPDEFVAFLANMGAYKRNGEGDRSTMLRLMDGGPISLERVGGSVRAEMAIMGLLASTQPEKIRTLAHDLGSDGMLQRIIFVVDDGIERPSLDIPPDLSALRNYDGAIRALASIDKLTGGTVRLAREAHDVMAGAVEQIRALAQLPGSSEAWEGHISKWEGLAFKILLIFHAVETWDFVGSVPVDVEVSASTARRASAFVFFLLRHAWRFYAEFYEPAAETQEARWIANWLLTRPELRTITPRDIERVRRSLQGNRRLTLLAMRSLERAGWVAPATMSTDAPSHWHVNPAVHLRFAERAVRETARRAEERRRIEAAVEVKRRVLNG